MERKKVSNGIDFGGTRLRPKKAADQKSRTDILKEIFVCDAKRSRMGGWKKKAHQVVQKKRANNDDMKGE